MRVLTKMLGLGLGLALLLGGSSQLLPIVDRHARLSLSLQFGSKDRMVSE